MKAVILAGGHGTRISEESAIRPKPMIDIGHHPILWQVGFIFRYNYGIAELRRRTAAGEIGEPHFADCWFRFANGMRGQWCVSRVTPPFAEYGYVEVIGTKGALKAALSRGRIDVLKASRPAAPAWEDVPLPREAKDDTQHALTRLMHGFVDACLRGQVNPDLDASFHDGLAARQGVAALLMADATAKWVPLEETQ
jgi:predicted dehydrogenase